MDWFAEIFKASTGWERVILLILASFAVFKKFSGKTKIKSIDKSIKIWLIKTKETLYEQMSVVEVVNASIVFQMRKVYADLSCIEKDVFRYDDIIVIAETECKSFIRKWFKENHFTSRSNIEFELYVNEKITFLLDMVAFELDKKYKNDHFQVCREELRLKNNDAIVPYAKEKWRKMFYDAREISRSSEKRIADLK